jgi:hypothetical protein
MLRLGELMGVIAPIVGLVVVWLMWARGRRLSRRALGVVTLLVCVFALWLVWLGTSDGLTPYQSYVPASLHDGEIVQGHGR